MANEAKGRRFTGGDWIDLLFITLFPVMLLVGLTIAAMNGGAQ